MSVMRLRLRYEDEPLTAQVGYHKDTEPLYHAFMYSPVILLSSIYPFMQCLSLLVTIICYRDI